MHPHQKKDWSLKIKQQATDLGFSYCGISDARYLEEDAPRLEKWLKQGHQGSMHYMERHFDMRLDPRLLLPGCKSVITLMFNYYSEDKQETDAPKLALYARGRDYHKVLKKKLFKLISWMQHHIGQEIAARAFVDSAPILERSWAAQSGLGWVGKNTMLIRKGAGSWFFIAEILCDVPLEADGPVKDFCGTCTACIDACPTEAIKPYHLEAEKCISYFTIELKEEINQQYQNNMNNWIFGCDICQEVCPWNRFAQPHREPEFLTNPQFLKWSGQEWLDLNEELFESTFKGSPLKRAGYDKIKKTLKFIGPSVHEETRG